MIVWRGYGWLALMVAVVINVSLNEAANAVFGIPPGVKHYRDAHPVVWLIGMGLSAAACWLLGTWLDAREQRNAKVLVDPSTNQSVKLMSKHDMFWIPIKWWAVVWLLAGLWLSWR